MENKVIVKHLMIAILATGFALAGSIFLQEQFPFCVYMLFCLLIYVFLVGVYYAIRQRIGVSFTIVTFIIVFIIHMGIPLIAMSVKTRNWKAISSCFCEEDSNYKTHSDSSLDNRKAADVKPLTKGENGNSKLPNDKLNESSKPPLKVSQDDKDAIPEPKVDEIEKRTDHKSYDQLKLELPKLKLLEADFRTTKFETQLYESKLNDVIGLAKKAQREFNTNSNEYVEVIQFEEKFENDIDKVKKYNQNQ